MICEFVLKDDSHNVFDKRSIEFRSFRDLLKKIVNLISEKYL